MWVQHIDESCPRLSTQVVFTAAISKIFSCILVFCLSALCVLQWAPRWDLLCHRNSVEREPSIKGRLDKVSPPLSARSLSTYFHRKPFSAWWLREPLCDVECPEELMKHRLWSKKKRFFKRRRWNWITIFCLWSRSEWIITHWETMSSYPCVPTVRLALGSLLWCSLCVYS